MILSYGVTHTIYFVDTRRQEDTDSKTGLTIKEKNKI